MNNQLMEQLLRGLLVYSTASYFTELVIHYLACKIINKKVPWVRIIVASFIVDILVCPLAYLGSARIILTGVDPQLLTYLLDMFTMVVNLLSIYLVIERRMAKAIIAGSFAYFIFYQSYMLSLIFVPLEYAMDSMLNQTISTGVLLIFTFILGRLIPKLNAAYFVNKCLLSRKYTIIVALVGLLLAGSTDLILMLAASLSGLNAMLIACGLCLLVLFFLLYYFVSRNVLHDERERLQDNIIVQQTSYIQSLEEIQKDVRLYRHDFKNMMAGMYLDVQQGNTDSIEKYMQDIFNHFDQNIDQKIQKANQLMHVEIVELKSLLLTKLNQLDEQQINYRLEVLYPLKSCAMNTHDLLRCIGILVDNAAEYVETNKGDVEVIITARKEDTTFLVTNTVETEVDMTKIWNKGYSTKGEARGMGLAGYREITDRYANVSCLTTCRDGRFFQELRIGG